MKQTELIVNPEGAVFHLNLRPGDLAQKVIIVGDPGRVETVASFFDKVKCRRENREFHTITGEFRGKEVSVISSGIGTDNIDILINELDAVVNFDLTTKSPKSNRQSLTLVRLGTSGGLQGDIPAGSFIITHKAIGFDNVMNFYNGIEQLTDLSFEEAFRTHTKWSERLSAPYIINADDGLYNKFTGLGMRSGMTVSAPGFYAPQGRYLSLSPYDPGLNGKLESFRYKGEKIDNYEMESSAIYGLSKLLGHKALTVCTVIGNRVTGEFIDNYKPVIRVLAETVLENI